MRDSDPGKTLQEVGLQVTAQRLAVLRAVSARPHCTAADVLEGVRSEINAVSRQAVYDALGVLTEHGILRRIQPTGSPARYEDRVGDNHHHLICRTCGDTIDVACAVGEAPCLEVDNAHGYTIDEAEVVYWGTCPKCRNPKSRRGKSRGEHPGEHPAGSPGGNPGAKQKSSAKR